MSRQGRHLVVESQRAPLIGQGLGWGEEGQRILIRVGVGHRKLRYSDKGTVWKQEPLPLG